MIDGRDLEPEAITEILIGRFLNQFDYNDNRKNYYCGIANDCQRRFSEHECEDWEIEEVIAIVDCGTENKAKRVETLMYDNGFDTGKLPGNGGKKDTVFVYLVKKGELVR